MKMCVRYIYRSFSQKINEIFESYQGVTFVVIVCGAVNGRNVFPFLLFFSHFSFFMHSLLTLVPLFLLSYEMTHLIKISIILPQYLLWIEFGNKTRREYSVLYLLVDENEPWPFCYPILPFCFKLENVRSWAFYTQHYRCPMNSIYKFVYTNPIIE